MLFYLVTALYVLVCFTMMLVVYLQQGKGGDIASAFGGGGSSQSAFGARSGATVLSRATWVAAAIFIIGALTLGIMGIIVNAVMFWLVGELSGAFSFNSWLGPLVGSILMGIVSGAMSHLVVSPRET